MLPNGPYSDITASSFLYILKTPPLLSNLNFVPTLFVDSILNLVSDTLPPVSDIDELPTIFLPFIVVPVIFSASTLPALTSSAFT